MAGVYVGDSKENFKFHFGVRTQIKSRIYY